MKRAGSRALQAALLSMAAAALAGGQAFDPGPLVRRMTLDEKISLVHGARDPEQLGGAGYWPGVPRLGIPPLRFADGPPGINVNRDATALPAPVGLAATFSTEAARLYGAVLGREARALRQDVVLAPHVNLVRDPLFRRNHTTLGEDPLLNARLGAAGILGIQGEGVLAQVKHFAAYNGAASVTVDERTLRELYLPAFEAAVKAGVASVMCAYSQVNGAGACQNGELLDGVLRGDWGFRGFVTSDWGATRGTRDIALGLDLEMPGREIAGRNAGPYFTAALKTAVEKGEIPEALLDRAVGRILYGMDRVGLLQRKPAAPPAPIDVAADARAARTLAEQGAVLLKNEGALPLAATDLASLAVIGPTARQLAVGFMGERAYGFEARLVAPLEALRRTAPRARIAYAMGNHLTGEAIPGPALKRDGPMDLTLAPGAEYSWTGTLTIPIAGEYIFMVQPAEGGGAEGSGAIAIDGRSVVRSGGFRFAVGVAERKWSSLLPTVDGRDNSRAAVQLQAGAHAIAFTASSTGAAPLRIRFAWSTPEMRRAHIEAAASAAKAARTAVVFAWSGGATALALPEDQDELIRRVAGANPRTIVVLNTGGPVAMPWKDGVRAILEMWYPGQEGGWATAGLLLGRVNPGGKLPVTFPAKLEDTPAHAPGAPAGVYSEGVMAGYRWYDRQRIAPLFPFGHGLSYTRFEYSRLAVRRAPAGGIEVAFTVRNTGARPGTEVPQVYLGPAAESPVPMPPQSLAGFERIELAPGQSRQVSIHVSPRSLAYWSVERHAWVQTPGGRAVLVGSSSRDIRLTGEWQPL